MQMLHIVGPDSGGVALAVFALLALLLILVSVLIFYALATRRSLAVLRSVVENLPCGLAVYDGQSRLTAHNEAFRELLELPASFFQGRQPRYDEYIALDLLRGEFASGPEAERIAELCRNLAREPRQIEFELERPNGRAVEVRAAPMPGGGVIITYADITERRRTETELRRSDQRLRGAMDAVDEAFVLFDPQDRLVLCNERYRSAYADVAGLLILDRSYEEILRDRIAASPAHPARKPRAAGGLGGGAGGIAPARGLQNGATPQRRALAAHHRSQDGRWPHRRPWGGHQ